MHDTTDRDRWFAGASTPSWTPQSYAPPVTVPDTSGYWDAGTGRSAVIPAAMRPAHEVTSHRAFHVTAATHWSRHTTITWVERPFGGEIQERDALETVSLAAAMTRALAARGVPDPIAGLASELGVLAF